MCVMCVRITSAITVITTYYTRAAREITTTILCFLFIRAKYICIYYYYNTTHTHTHKHTLSILLSILFCFICIRRYLNFFYWCCFIFISGVLGCEYINSWDTTKAIDDRWWWKKQKKQFVVYIYCNYILLIYLKSCVCWVIVRRAFIGIIGIGGGYT